MIPKTEGDAHKAEVKRYLNDRFVPVQPAKLEDHEIVLTQKPERAYDIDDKIAAHPGLDKKRMLLGGITLAVVLVAFLGAGS